METLARKHLVILLTCCLFSAGLAILLDRIISPRERIIIREPAEARLTLNEDLLNSIRPRTFLSSAPTDFTHASEAVTEAVVFIRTFNQNRLPLWNEQTEPLTISTGSGVLISPDGYIATNNHVIENGKRIQVVLSDRREFLADVVGVDKSTDLALLKIDGAELPFAEFGNSDSLRVGEWVLAVGNPFNLESTVTAGIVSAKGRSIDVLEGQDRIESFIQTDAAVNPGNSGGALVNTNGELIGINTAIVTRSGRYEGYAFAVPSNLARKIIRDLRDYGQVQRGMLGVYIERIDARRASQLGLEKAEGIFVRRIRPGGSAEESGLQPSDVIIGINGTTVRTPPEMQEQISRFRPGNKITIKYIREGEVRSTEVVLKNKNNGTSLVSEREEELFHKLGFELRNLTRAEADRLKLESGVKVVSIFRGSRIERTNMEPGFIITHLNDRAVRDVDQFINRLERLDEKALVSGIYEEYPGEYYYAFSMD